MAVGFFGVVFASCGWGRSLERNIDSKPFKTAQWQSGGIRGGAPGRVENQGTSTTRTKSRVPASGVHACEAEAPLAVTLAATVFQEPSVVELSTR